MRSGMASMFQLARQRLLQAFGNLTWCAARSASSMCAHPRRPRRDSRSACISCAIRCAAWQGAWWLKVWRGRRKGRGECVYKVLDREECAWRHILVDSCFVQHGLDSAQATISFSPPFGPLCLAALNTGISFRSL
eukprot:362411-Chlamydomonas_euryale.AAC.3